MGIRPTVATLLLTKYPCPMLASALPLPGPVIRSEIVEKSFPSAFSRKVGAPFGSSAAREIELPTFEAHCARARAFAKLLGATKSQES